MKKIVFALLIMAVFSGGCAQHYYRTGNSSVEIFLKAPKAQCVLFASSLDGYKPHPASKADGKTWVVRVPSVREFRYFYIIDGSVFVPDCACHESDEFDSENCIYIPGM